MRSRSGPKHKAVSHRRCVHDPYQGSCVARRIGAARCARCQRARRRLRRLGLRRPVLRLVVCDRGCVLELDDGRRQAEDRRSLESGTRPERQAPTSADKVTLTKAEVAKLKQGSYTAALLWAGSGDWYNAVSADQSPLQGARDRH